MDVYYEFILSESGIEINSNSHFIKKEKKNTFCFLSPLLISILSAYPAEGSSDTWMAKRSKVSLLSLFTTSSPLDVNHHPPTPSMKYTIIK